MSLAALNSRPFITAVHCGRVCLHCYQQNSTFILAASQLKQVFYKQQHTMHSNSRQYNYCKDTCYYNIHAPRPINTPSPTTSNSEPIYATFPFNIECFKRDLVKYSQYKHLLGVFVQYSKLMVCVILYSHLILKAQRLTFSEGSAIIGVFSLSQRHCLTSW